MYPAKYLCQSDEWHTKSVSSNVLAFRRSLSNLPLFCHTEVMSSRKSTESGRTMFWCFTVMTSIASEFFCNLHLHSCTVRLHRRLQNTVWTMCVWKELSLTEPIAQGCCPLLLHVQTLVINSFMPDPLLLCLGFRKGICDIAVFGVIESAVYFVKSMLCLVL